MWLGYTRNCTERKAQFIYAKKMYCVIVPDVLSLVLTQSITIEINFSAKLFKLGQNFRLPMRT